MFFLLAALALGVGGLGMLASSNNTQPTTSNTSTAPAYSTTYQTSGNNTTVVPTAVSVPEPSEVLGTVALGALGVGYSFKRYLKKSA